MSALDIRTGAVSWVWRPTPEPAFRSGSQGAAISGDTIYVNTWWGLNAIFNRADAGIVALDRRTGEQLWRTILPDSNMSTAVIGRPAVWRHLVITALGGGRIYAVNRWTGQVEWKIAPSSVLHGTRCGVAIFGDVLYFDDSQDHIMAVRPEDGSVVWRTFTSGMLSSDLLITENRIYAPSWTYLNILDRQTGRYVARVEQPEPIINRDDTPFGLIGNVFTGTGIAVGKEIYFQVGFGVWSFREP